MMNRNRIFLRAALCALIYCATAVPAQAAFISASPQENLYFDRNRGALDEDDCPPQTIVSIPLTINGNTTGSNWNFLSSCNGNGPDDVYALSLSCDYQVTVSLCNSGFDTVIEVHHGTNYFDCPGAYVDCNDDFCGVNGWRSQLTFFAAVGEFYFIIISGYNGATGPYSLEVTGTSFPPPNDVCSGATLISTAPYQDFGSTVCAGNGFSPSCAFSNAGDVVYRLNMPCNAFMTVTTCGHPLMDAVIDVYKYGACPGTNFVTCNDDACANNQSAVNFVYEAFQDYYIIVDGYSANTGYYVLHVTAQGNAEDQCGVIILDLPVTLNGTLVCEHNDYPQCAAGESNDDVFVLQPSAECRLVTVSLCGSPESFDSVLEIRRGGSQCPGDVVVSCTDDGECGGVFSYHSTVTFTAEANETYYLMVNGYFGSEGPYSMTVTGAPCELPAPEHLVIQPDAGGAGVWLYWDFVPGAASYNIYRSVGYPNPGLPDLIATTFDNFFLDPEYPPNPCLIYEVTAVSGAVAAQTSVTPPEIALAKQQAQALQQSAVTNSQPRSIDLPPWVSYEYTVK